MKHVKSGKYAKFTELAPSNESGYDTKLSTAVINFQGSGGYKNSIKVVACAYQSPIEIYEKANFKASGVLYGKFRVTFASVRFNNVTVQVV